MEAVQPFLWPLRCLLCNKAEGPSQGSPALPADSIASTGAVMAQGSVLVVSRQDDRPWARLGLHVVNGWWVLSVNNPKEGRQRSKDGDPLPLSTKAASVQLAACGQGIM